MWRVHGDQDLLYKFYKCYDFVNYYKSNLLYCLLVVDIYHIIILFFKGKQTQTRKVEVINMKEAIYLLGLYMYDILVYKYLL